MPKVTRKDTEGPLQSVPMETEVGEEDLPSKPNFGALSAKDINGNKVEFRRVRCGAVGGGSGRIAPHAAHVHGG
jgi:hypothetical protein